MAAAASNGASNGSANGMPDYEVIIIGAGVAGIYQMYRLAERGVHATVLEMGSDLGGTWFWNRYPGCRFDSESYTYGYSFSDELLDEWHWKERFSGQPENLRYLNYVADKFDLRKYMQFNCAVETAHFDDDAGVWRLHLGDGRDLSCRFLLTALGLLSAPTYPRIEGVEADGTDVFEGPSFHTYHWPAEPVEIKGKRVAVIGTGATGVQAIAAIGEQADHLTVFQRRPNWCAPLHNSEISDEEMAGIRARYDQIFDKCARTPGGFEHEPDRRGFWNVPPEERRAMWETASACNACRWRRGTTRRTTARTWTWWTSRTRRSPGSPRQASRPPSGTANSTSSSTPRASMPSPARSTGSTSKAAAD